MIFFFPLMANAFSSKHGRLVRVGILLFHWLDSADGIVDIKIRYAERPAGQRRQAERVQYDAFYLAHVCAGQLQMGGDLGRCEELVPIVCAHRQPTQNVLGADNGHGVGFVGAIHGGQKEQTARLKRKEVSKI